MKLMALIPKPKTLSAVCELALAILAVVIVILASR
jgi:hypothetical protein